MQWFPNLILAPKSTFKVYYQFAERASKGLNKSYWNQDEAKLRNLFGVTQPLITQYLLNHFDDFSKRFHQTLKLLLKFYV